MKDIMYRTFIAAAVLAAPWAKAVKLDCTVTIVNPDYAYFFSPDSQTYPPPVVGDVTHFDTAAEVISDITYDSGHTLPLKVSGAKFYLDSSFPSGTRYLLSFSTAQYDYNAVLLFYDLGAGTDYWSQLQVVQRNREDGLSLLHEMWMDCAAAR